MIVVRDFDRLKGKELVATIGFFDGVHLGHRFLIDEMKEIAKARNLPSAVITFPEHPRAVLHADYQPKLLNSFEEKLQQLETTGVDYCIVLDFTIELSRLSAKEFITSILAKSLHVNDLIDPDMTIVSGTIGRMASSNMSFMAPNVVSRC